MGSLCKTLLGGALAALLAGPAPAFAGVEEVVVTGTRVLPPVGQAAFSSVTLNADALTHDDRLDEALSQVPGLSLFRRNSSINANPTTQGVSLRSIAPSGAGRALVLLDGVPMNDPFGGWVIWSALPGEDLQSAEVVRGAGAGPYGAGALTGTISLTEKDSADGLAIADVSGGSLGSYRAAASGGTTIGKVSLFGSVAGERSDGWIPVRAPDRGAADNHLWLGSSAASLRAQTQFGDVNASARIGFYDEARGSGLLNTGSTANGINGSLVFAKAPHGTHIGWRVQTWIIRSNFTNRSASVAPDRSSTTPANDQFATPALGWGANAAIIGVSGNFRWEAGGDLRVNTGTSKEHYFNLSGVFQNERLAGGRLTVGGLYGEAAYDTGAWLLTGGLRGDYWGTAQGHLIEQKRFTGVVLTDVTPPGRSGIVPTGRVGVRRNFTNGQYLRVASYAGFRPPSLNELYRPFRVGNDVTTANAALTPEKLYGAEIGWGGTIGATEWSVTGFWNDLTDAIANVTIGTSVAGGAQRQRQNAGDIRALGFEGEVKHYIRDVLALRAAISVTDARVAAGANAPQLDGKRPAQAPRMTITGGAQWLMFAPLSLRADIRYESMRFDDDLNTRRLGSAFVVDVAARWRLRDGLSAFVALDNAFDANVTTGVTGANVYSYGEPRTFRVELTYNP